VLVKAGILPGGNGFKQEDVTITGNDSGKYEDRWVYLAPQTTKCVFIDPGQLIYVPVAHGEGKVVARDGEALQKLRSEGHIAFKYVDANGAEGPFPINPNGSVDSVAGLTDTTGRVLGLMPHPERYVRRTQHPHWSRLGPDLDPDGIRIFRNAVRYVRETILESLAAQSSGGAPVFGAGTPEP
jgi:phosphoribosylformylglycinamidine (FGAM) synthase-like amidotransferase family enzyme